MSSSSGHAAVEADFVRPHEPIPGTRQIGFVRTYEICFNRSGRPDDELIRRVIAQLDPHFPAPTFHLNWVLCETLGLPAIAHGRRQGRGASCSSSRASQDEQMEYAPAWLRMLAAGWTVPLRTAYFKWSF